MSKPKTITRGFIEKNDIAHIGAIDRRSVDELEGINTLTNRQLSDYLEEDGSDGFLALEVNKKKASRVILGYCLFHVRDGQVWLTRMVVDKADRRKKVASQMMESLMTISKKVNVLCPERCDSAVYFLKSLGFKARIHKKNKTIYHFKNFPWE